ncbi:MAG: alkane 1-monooxygenase [Cyclobacteriaceae bacterium]|nr:alkane 1-monooxygenase [Cyclobacteriaceae bacterium]
MTPVKYFTVFTLPILAFFSVHLSGWLTFLPLFYAFGFIPLVELLFNPQNSNLSQEEESRFVQNPAFDLLLYAAAIVHFIFFAYYFIAHIPQPGDHIALVGNTVALGLMCGIFGINIAHELGHRKNRFEQLLAKLLLLTSLYMHFTIEHNRGHHRYVATNRDPASAPRQMTLYRFWLRSVTGSFVSAWKLENIRLSKKEKAKWLNQVMWYVVIEFLFLAVIFYLFGLVAMLSFLAAATIGILLLETVNYIEHYGLRRKQINELQFERVMPWHSWNSSHILGRLMLFELSRHSDHHYLASRKYQILRHHQHSPQLPTGYPGMMLLSFIPPLWFKIVHKHLADFQQGMSQEDKQLSI